MNAFLLEINDVYKRYYNYVVITSNMLRPSDLYCNCTERSFVLKSGVYHERIVISLNSLETVFV